MSPTTLALLSLGFLAAAAALILTLWVTPLIRQRRVSRTLDSALARHAGVERETPTTGPSALHTTHAASHPTLNQSVSRLSERVGTQWIGSRFGRYLLTEEDAQLLNSGGFYGPRSRAMYAVVRVLVPVALLLLALTLSGEGRPSQKMMAAFTGFAIGFLLPKWLLRQRVTRRTRQVEEELPILVDLLRLLQGVGLSIDQSLQVIATEFGTMLRVLGPELVRANQQFASGRSREATLLRLSSLFQHEDLKSLMQLLTQVDKFGGAVQEPLRQFGNRLQETRRSQLKDRVGRLTVKMTLVMILTLLPAILIITAGPGFLGVIRTLGRATGV
jgi:tight adherence protein C